MPYDRFAFLMPRDRLALAVLRAALSPDLNASSLVFRDYVFIHTAMYIYIYINVYCIYTCIFTMYIYYVYLVIENHGI